MKIKEFKIPYPYNDYLNSIYYFECYDPEHSFFLPDGHPELMVANRPISVSARNKDVVSPNKILFWGQLRFSGHLNASGPYKVCGVKFQPWTLAILSQNHAINLVDSIIDGRIIFSDLFIETTKVLAKIDWQCDQQKLMASKTIGHLFLKEFRSNIVIKHNFIQTVIFIKKHNGMQSMADLLPEYKQSIRTLGNDFMKYIGISPKEYQTIIRLRKSSIILKKGYNILHTALDLGYFDNAHFTKEFKRFSGVSPKEFSKQKNLVVATV
ncbi:helix-turn-helix domain-containing protein [Croceitalea sp. MTPC5]|uniref:helix-turn-helix domain-containing protein n=1 Tax=Croceitalea sp. MTPC5 TaxID=3056565 RepID=UPI002B3EBD30|nr:helix-turn-helix domain-containing protein [Croceitalea sp. MTPC5]